MWKRRIEETVQFEFVKQDHLHWRSWNSKYYYHCHARTQQRENHSWTKAHRTSLWPNYPLLHIRFSFLFHKTAKQLKSFKKYILKEKLKFAEWEFWMDMDSWTIKIIKIQPKFLEVSVASISTPFSSIQLSMYKKSDKYDGILHLRIPELPRIIYSFSASVV